MRGIFTPLLSVTHGTDFSGASALGAANIFLPPMPKKMAEAALVCRNCLRFIELILSFLSRN
jgi:hypothetical protein